MKTIGKAMLTTGFLTVLLAGCGSAATTQNTTSQNASGDVSKVLGTSYNSSTQTVTLRVKKVVNATGEDVVDTRDNAAVANYVTCTYPNRNIRSVHVNTAGKTMTVNLPPVTVRNAPTAAIGTTVAGAMTATGTVPLPPPGTSIDPTLQPLAGLSAPIAQKENAIMQVAKSKLGTPYVWGHSEDRGQFGFDCSNFTAYVYHHALGYRMSGASQTQYRSVGVPISTSQIRTGDLLVFDSGGHVGIYAGNGSAIQEGGGLKKVGYLKLTPGSYWWHHLTVVKRMF